MSSFPADRITMPHDCNHDQLLPSFGALSLSNSGGSIRIYTREDLYANLSPVSLPFASYPPVAIPDDSIIWQYAIHYTNTKTPRNPGEVEIRVPQRAPELQMKDYLLVVRRERKLRTYMRTRIVAILSCMCEKHRREAGHIAAARGCIAYIDRCLLHLLQTERTYLDAWRAEPGPDYTEWNELCDAVVVFDQGWLKLAGVPLDETFKAELLRRVAVRALGN